MCKQPINKWPFQSQWVRCCYLLFQLANNHNDVSKCDIDKGIWPQAMCPHTSKKIKITHKIIWDQRIS
jgi:hypothetical protein